MGTASGVHYVLDAYDLSILRRLEGHQQGLGRLSGEEVCWTSDSHWVLSGSPDGSIAVWDLTAPNGQTKLEPLSGPNEPAPTLKPTTVLRPSNEAPVPASRAVQFNPRYGMLAVGGEDLVSNTLNWNQLGAVLITRPSGYRPGQMKKWRLRKGHERFLYHVDMI